MTHGQRSIVLPAMLMLLAASILTGPGSSAAQTNATAPSPLGTSDNVETRIGTLTFNDGVPSSETAENVRDALAFTRALNVYNNSFRGASAYAIRSGFHSIGAQDNTSVLIFSELMDSTSLFLTGNADTVYYMASLDLTDGPIVIEQPSGGLGTINDMWFQWVIDIGRSGPDRGLGGKYMIVGPGYDGPLPEGGYFVAHARTNHALYVVRAFIDNGNDPKPAVDNIKENLKIYPYQPGSYGTSIAEALKGEVSLAGEPKIPGMKFIEGSGLPINTIPPSDYRFFETINENVQSEPATSYDVELAGQLAAIGIVKGKAFNPNERMKRILTDAAAVGQAVGRSLTWRSPELHPDWVYYENLRWFSPLWQGGAFFETPPPLFEDGVFKPYPVTGARTLDARTAFYYSAILDSPAMIMRLPGAGSQYLFGALDNHGEPFDGSKTYKVTLPPDIPARAFWSLTLYDNQTRSMLQTPQRYPRAGSQSYPSPAAVADADGSTAIWIAPEQPEGVPRGNWIQSVPGKGWFTLLRLYSPLQAFFDKSWRPSEIELVQ